MAFTKEQVEDVLRSGAIYTMNQKETLDDYPFLPPIIEYLTVTSGQLPQMVPGTVGGADEKTGRLFVEKSPDKKQRSYYSTAGEADANLLELKAVPVIFLNEMLAAVELIKGKEK